MANIAGDSQPATDLAGQSVPTTASNATFLTISLEVLHSAPTTVLSRRGLSLLRCRLLLKSLYPAYRIFVKWTWERRGNTGSNRRSISRLLSRIVRRVGGSRRITSES